MLLPPRVVQIFHHPNRMTSPCPFSDQADLHRSAPTVLLTKRLAPPETRARALPYYAAENLAFVQPDHLSTCRWPPSSPPMALPTYLGITNQLAHPGSLDGPEDSRISLSLPWVTEKNTCPLTCSTCDAVRAAAFVIVYVSHAALAAS